MTDLGRMVGELNDSGELFDIIDKYQKNSSPECDSKEGNPEHEGCLLGDAQSAPSCHRALVALLIQVIGTKSNLIDDNIKAKVVECFKHKNIKIKQFVSIENLTILHKSGSQLISWIKYESLLTLMIKEQIYEPKTMANEVLTIVKDELNPAIACKLASVINGCVKYCRETNKDQLDEEEEEKWCEIIDWMSWFLASKDDDFS